jgi:predicted nucleic acid-binding protein
VIFVDTGFLVALFNKRDKHHRRVAEVFQGFKGKSLTRELLTTDLVILEEHGAAFEYLKRHRDKKYSAVDCLSFVVMEKLGIREALAVDSDFQHRFIARPGPG